MQRICPSNFLFLNCYNKWDVNCFSAYISVGGIHLSTYVGLKKKDWGAIWRVFCVAQWVPSAPPHIQGGTIRRVSAAPRCKWSLWIMYPILGHLFYYHIRYKAINRYFKLLSIYINSQGNTLIVVKDVLQILLNVSLSYIENKQIFPLISNRAWMNK